MYVFLGLFIGEFWLEWKFLLCYNFFLVVVIVFFGICFDGVGLNNIVFYIMIVYCVGVVIVIVYDVYISLNKSSKVGFNLVKGEINGKLIVFLIRILCKYCYVIY